MKAGTIFIKASPVVLVILMCVQLKFESCKGNQKLATLALGLTIHLLWTVHAGAIVPTLGSTQ